MKSFDINKVKQFWLNPDSGMIKELEILETRENGDVVFYMRIKMPLMSDRDNVALIHEEDIEDGGKYISCQTIEWPSKPPMKGVIRMFQQVTSVVKPDPNDPTQTLYTEIDSFDMKGSIPAKLMNLVLASETAKEFKKLYKYAQTN
jgi:hypothetical protein